MSGSWAPLPPTRADRWLVGHRRALHVALAVATSALATLALWLVVGHRVGWAFLPVGAYAVAQVGVLHVVLRRAGLRVAGAGTADRPGWRG